MAQLFRSIRLLGTIGRGTAVEMKFSLKSDSHHLTRLRVFSSRVKHDSQRFLAPIKVRPQIRRLNRQLRLDLITGALTG